ncbi:MAG: hypothetical protein QG671_2032 [Actinomycetota bacterium]|nr:hypothetical protein [Actinomycetota bacterium]
MLTTSRPPHRRSRPALPDREGAMEGSSHPGVATEPGQGCFSGPVDPSHQPERASGDRVEPARPLGTTAVVIQCWPVCTCRRRTHLPTRTANSARGNAAASRTTNPSLVRGPRQFRQTPSRCASLTNGPRYRTGTSARPSSAHHSTTSPSTPSGNSPAPDRRARAHRTGPAGPRRRRPGPDGRSRPCPRRPGRRHRHGPGRRSPTAPRAAGDRCRASSAAPLPATGGLRHRPTYGHGSTPASRRTPRAAGRPPRDGCGRSRRTGLHRPGRAPAGRWRSHPRRRSCLSSPVGGQRFVTGLGRGP